MSAETNIDETIKAARAANVDKMLCVATTPKQFAALAEIGHHPDVFTSIGLHPTEDPVAIDKPSWLDHAKRSDVIAIGETGLDYYREHSRSAQIQNFEKQIEISNEVDLPLIIHTRMAKEDTLAVLKQAESGAVMHCFTEDAAMAKKCLDMGLYISFSGIVTFRNAEELRQVAKMVPADRLLVETDTPYLAPVPHRGKQNQPAWVSVVGEFIAELRGVSVDELAQVTSENFYRLFQAADTEQTHDV